MLIASDHVSSLIGGLELAVGQSLAGFEGGFIMVFVCFCFCGF